MDIFPVSFLAFRYVLTLSTDPLLFSCLVEGNQLHFTLQMAGSLSTLTELPNV